MLSVRGATVWRGERSVLSGIDLTLSAGETVVIVGPNGAGKTTLLEAILGLAPLRAGTIELDGVALTSLARKAVARRIGYLPQRLSGYEGYRVTDVVTAARYAYLHPFAALGDADRQAIGEAVASCALEPLLERRLDALSGGERQRVWLAAAFAQQTPLLLLDEPTSALDPRHTADLIGRLRARREAGDGLLVVTHDWDLVRALDARVVGLADGARVIDVPSPAALDAAALRTIYGCEFEVGRDPQGRALVHVRV